LDLRYRGARSGRPADGIVLVRVTRVASAEKRQRHGDRGEEALDGCAGGHVALTAMVPSTVFTMRRHRLTITGGSA
ncbi:MAG: hypothetical protein M3O70_26985, partial [Actinomycetota bacterium]|nr:hypothetical protein [Actinomycetota bacterium]